MVTMVNIVQYTVVYPLISTTESKTLNTLFLLMLNKSPCEVFAVPQFFLTVYFSFLIKSGFSGQMSLHNFENTRRNAHISNIENRKEFRYQFLNTLPSKYLVSPVSRKTVTNTLRYVQ